MLLLQPQVKLSGYLSALTAVVCHLIEEIDRNGAIEDTRKEVSIAWMTGGRKLGNREEIPVD